MCVPIASLLLMIIIDPVVSEAMSKTKDKRQKNRSWHCALCKSASARIASEQQVNTKKRRPCDFLQSASPLVFMHLRNKELLKTASEREKLSALRFFAICLKSATRFRLLSLTRLRTGKIASERENSRPCDFYDFRKHTIKSQISQLLANLDKSTIKGMYLTSTSIWGESL